jgi:hypothetical protein
MGVDRNHFIVHVRDQGASAFGLAGIFAVKAKT